jgi:subtilase family serine protease
VVSVGVVIAVGLAVLAALVGGRGSSAAGALPMPSPTVADYAQLSNSTTPPSQSDCNSVGRRCFSPASTQNSYNLAPLYGAGVNGNGITIAIIDSYGSDTIAHDLHVFDTQMGLPLMCGEEGVTCTNTMPTFNQLSVQGSPATKAPPPKNNGTGIKDKSLWALEVSLDVEWAHSIAPRANILLVTTPTAETLGVNGFPQMMAAEDYVVKNHLAQVISQSFAAAEETFGGTKSLLNLRNAFIDASQNGVTALAGSGDFGTANPSFTPVKNPTTIPFPTVSWPASDPLVTGVGGTYLCTDANTGTSVDTASPPANCQTANNPTGAREIGWIASGGGFSHIFATPAFQNTLPAGSTAIGANRGVPDVAMQASARTGVLIYITLPPDGQSGLICPGGSPCSTGWYVIGGTSVATPEWAGIVALADQVNGGGLGLINPGLYKIGADPTRYANDFYDVTHGNNQTDPNVTGYPATTGWDPITGLGTPNAANLVPDLVAAVHGH